MLPTSDVCRRGPRGLLVLESCPCGCWPPNIAMWSAHRRRRRLAHVVQLRTHHMRWLERWPGNHRCSQPAAGQTRCPVNPVEEPGRSRRAPAPRKAELGTSPDGLAHSCVACQCWIDGADGSSNAGAPGRSHIYQACIGCQLPRTLAVNWQALERRSDMATTMRPVGGPGGHDAVLWRGRVPWPP